MSAASSKGPILALILAASVAASMALVACGDDDDGGASTEGNQELFTSSGFEKAVDAVEAESGADAPILRIQITSGGAEFQIREGEQAGGFIYTGGSLEDVDVEVIGTGSLEGRDFPLDQVDPAAIDKIVTGVTEESGIDDIEVTVMTLEKQLLDNELKWVINAEGGGRSGLVYNASPDGTGVVSATGDIPGASTGDTGATGAGGATGGGTPPAAQDIVECIQQAAGDPAKIQACAK